MKINLAKSRGFCFGVKRAIDVALKTADAGKPVHMLGDIVHNETVMQQIEKSGIKKVKKLKAGKGRIFLLQAHGTPLKILLKAKKLKYTIVDATCPMVKEIQKQAQNMEKKKYKIIVIGDKKHDEVKGIVGHLKTKAIVIDKPQNIPFKQISRLDKVCVVSQSTQDIENVTKILNILGKYIKNLKFCNTICLPTKLKQNEIKQMPKENDVMIIIGSKHSANTKRLYEISKALNKRSYWVNSYREIKKDWLNNAKNIGIAAGASTPDSTTKEIIEYIGKLDGLPSEALA